MNSHLDEISIESARKITGTKKYGRLSIGLIQDRLDLAAENTRLSIGRISDMVQKLHIKNKFVALQINISLLNAFRVHIAGRGNRYLLLKLPARKVSGPCSYPIAPGLTGQEAVPLKKPCFMCNARAA